MRMTEATDEINDFFHPFVADRSSWSNVTHHCSLLETKDACEKAGCAVTHDEDYCVPPMAIPPAVFFGHFSMGEKGLLEPWTPCTVGTTTRVPR